MVVLMRGEGSTRGTDQQGRAAREPVTTPEGGSESRSGAREKDSTTRKAGHEREVATPFLFFYWGFCVNDCGRHLWVK